MASNDTDFLAEAREKFQLAADEEHEIRREAREDLRFVAGRQWDEATRRERVNNDRPALVFNRLPTFIQQVSNEARQNKLAIRFTRTDDPNDKDTAEILEGLARQIQYSSKAALAYETAVEANAQGGFGYFRMLTDYAGDDTFDQEVQFASIVDPFAVYGLLVPACFARKPRCAFVVEDMLREEFKQEWPDSELISIGFDSGMAAAPEWITENTVRIAEYWYTETKPRTLLLLSNGLTVHQDELSQLRGELGELPPGMEVVNQRRVLQDRILVAKMNGVEVLPGTKTEWPGPNIPIYTVLGRRMIIDGRPEVYSLVRFLRDPQRLVNFYKSGIAEEMGLTNRVPYIGATGQFENHEQKWRTANTKNWPYLEYNEKSLGGHLVGPPQRQVYEAPIQAFSLAAAQEIDDMKAIAGIFDASLGNQGNETSGIAIRRRQMQSNITNLHFVGNLVRAQEQAGTDLVSVIRQVYDTERMVRILGEDETERIVKLNGEGVDEKTGKPTNFDLSVGKYDVRVTSQPSYTTKREEGFAVLSEFARAYPALMEIGGDIIFRNSETPGADELSERFKKLLPPVLQENEDQQIPPQVQQQMQALMQQHEALVKALDEATQAIDSKKFELESKERIAAMTTQAQLIMTEAKLGSAEGIALLREEVAAISARLQLLNIDEPVEEQEGAKVQ